MANVERVLDICVAYEEGYQHGRLLLSADHNEYPDKSECFYAWYLGHNNGLQTELVETEDVTIN